MMGMMPAASDCSISQLTRKMQLKIFAGVSAKTRRIANHHVIEDNTEVLQDVLPERTAVGIRESHGCEAREEHEHAASGVPVVAAKHPVLAWEVEIRDRIELLI